MCCVESFAHIECYSVCSRRGSHLVEPLCYGVVRVCSAVTVEFCIRVALVCLVCLLLGKEEGSSSVSAITKRRDVGLYEVPLSMSLLGFGMGTMLTNFHMCGIMLALRAVFNMLVRNASPRGPMCFRCLMFNLSGPCELLFILCCIASWT